MEDIYGDLDNYNDVNVVEELRNENKELKFKLEEYAASMDRLQKDFDRVSSEFKKLEINYSSLLKTARAEIERKTQIITNLNMEKDMMVLNSINHNSKKGLAAIRRNIARERSANFKSRKDFEPELEKGNKTDLPISKKLGSERDRNEETRLPSIETVSSMNMDDTNKLVDIDNKLNKTEFYDKAVESKENINKGKRAQLLKHRRKSMPAPSKQYAKFSSDEEYEGNCSEDVNTRRDDNRKHFDRLKQCHKISETSGIDEKYSSYHESSRETYYKGKLHRYTDKYKSSRDRYDTQRHSKRFYSPERTRRRDFAEEQQRSDFGRYRVLESPPVERYDSQRWYRDRRSNYKNEDNVGDRFKPQPEKAIKHKTPSEYEVPPTKRARTESSGVSTEKDVRENVDYLQPNISHHTDHKKLLPDFLEDLQQSSCQSPDYIYSDVTAISTQPVKEIMATAITKLEDPRLSNNKYVKKVEGDKVTLCSTTGLHVNLQPVDTSGWEGINRVEVPKALQVPPPETTNSVQNVYSNIADPILNISMESGELNSETNDGMTVAYVTKSFLQDYENERINLKNSGNDKINILIPRRYTENKSTIENKIKSQQDTCEVSKSTKPEQNLAVNPLKILLGQLDPIYKVDNTVKPHEPKLDVDETFGIDNEITYKEKCIVPEHKREERTKCKISEKKSEEKRKVKIPEKSYEDNKITLPDKKCEDKMSQKKCEEKSKDVVLDEMTEEKSKRMAPEKKCEEKTKIMAPEKKCEEKTKSMAPEKKCEEKTKSMAPEKKSEEKSKSTVMVKKSEDKRKPVITEKKCDEKSGLKSLRQLRSSRKLSAQEIVEGDLALSDETCDNTELIKHIKKVASKKEKEISNTEELSKATHNKLKKVNIEEVGQGLQAKDSIEESSELFQNDNNAKLNKKKARETRKIAETKPKAEKTKDPKVKTKFSELFGDSSSLITPEDLGVVTEQAHTGTTVKYVPIFEDAQDAIDLNVVAEETQKQLLKTSKDNAKIVETSLSTGVMPKSILPSEPNMNVNKNESENKTRISVPDGTPNIIVSPEVTKESDVVKTIIISTGVQPQIDRIEPYIKEHDVNLIKNDTQKNNLLTRVKDPILALATSTPYKKHLVETEIEASCTSSETVERDDTSSVEQSTISNGLDTNNDADVPDVRIFVKRRRKLRK